MAVGILCQTFCEDALINCSLLFTNVTFLTSSNHQFDNHMHAWINCNIFSVLIDQKTLTSNIPRFIVQFQNIWEKVDNTGCETCTYKHQTINFTTTYTLESIVVHFSVLIDHNACMTNLQAVQISAKISSVMASDKRILLTVLELNDFQLRNKKHKCNPDFYYFLCLPEVSFQWK